VNSGQEVPAPPINGWGQYSKSSDCSQLVRFESNVIKKPGVLIMAKIAKAVDVFIEELIK